MGIPATGWLGAWRIKRSAAEDEIIDMISLLEARLGAGPRAGAGARHYETLKPLPHLGHDPQDLAEQIARFADLGEELFIVSVVKTPDGVAGQIELQHGEPGLL